MSSLEQAGGDEGLDPLVQAIEENPEAVAEVVRRADAVNELLDAVELAQAAFDDEMVQSIAGSGATLGEAASELATEETVALSQSVGANGGDLAGGLETLARLQREGTLDTLAEAADAIALATAALDDEMVASLAGTGARLGELADAAADERTAAGLEDLLTAVREAEASEPERVGAIGLLRSTRDPEIQAGLGFLLALARGIGRSRAVEE
jgi:uncharacterized protein YjgD (DUF1641 family)